jgi:tripartite-type tricarboxylate transporter receptor subunit TctC
MSPTATSAPRRQLEFFRCDGNGERALPVFLLACAMTICCLLPRTAEPDFAVALAQIKGGKLKGLGVTSLTRTPLAPGIPAISEALPGFETVLWFGLVAPAGTPREVVIKLYSAGLEGLAKPEVKARFDSLGLTIAPLSPEEFSRYITSEISKWTREAKEAGIQPE